MCDADDRWLTNHELGERLADQTKTCRERAEYAIEFLARCGNDMGHTGPLNEQGMKDLDRAQVVLLSLLNEYDDMEVALR